MPTADADARERPSESRAMILIRSVSVLMTVLAILVFVVGAMVGYMIHFMSDSRTDRTNFQNEQRYILCEHVGFDQRFCEHAKDFLSEK